jgi:peptide/nickel transport system substrate-binding protein
LDRIVLRIVPDKSTAVRLLRVGELDFVEELSPREAQSLRPDSTVARVVTCRGRDYDFIGYNAKDPRLGDVRVREALTRAIDRDAIAQQLLAGYVEPLDGPIVPTMWAFDKDLPHVPYDPAGARSLFAAAGWQDSNGDGWLDRNGQRFELELLTNSDNERRRLVVVPVQSDWKAVGVKAEVRTLERGALLDLRAKGQFQAVLGGWGTNLAMELSSIWSCQGGRNNFVKYCNPRVDSLMSVAAYLPYEQAKPPLYELQRLVARDHPYTFMYFTHYVVALSPRLHNVVIDARATITNPDSWWVTDATTAAR